MALVRIDPLFPAFQPACIGPRVVRAERVVALLEAALDRHVNAPWQRPFWVKLPEVDPDDFLGGHGLRSTRPEDYFLACHKGVVHPFLRRDKALPVRAAQALCSPARLHDEPMQEAFVLLALITLGPEPDTLTMSTTLPLLGKLLRSRNHDEALQLAAHCQAWERQFSIVGDPTPTPSSPEEQ